MHRALCWIVSLGLGASFGCGGPTLVPVKGTLKLDGKPLANATLTFLAQTQGNKDAHGTTNAEGAFQLSTLTRNDGAMPGEYKIMVHYAAPIVVPSNLKDAEDVQKAVAAAAATQKQSIVLPPIYTEADQTVLKHKVPEDGDVKLDLQSVKR